MEKKDFNNIEIIDIPDTTQEYEEIMSLKNNEISIEDIDFIQIFNRINFDNYNLDYIPSSSKEFEENTSLL